MGKIFEILNVSSGYDEKQILNNISFDLQEGEVIALIGQNGCGKSTLLKTLARIIKDNSGTINFEDENLNNKNTWDLQKAGISWFLQGGMVFPTLKVSEHFDLVLRDRKKLDANKIKEKCFFYFPELRDQMKKRGGNLSGGQKQMLSFAMLIAQETHLWLLDEPTAGLSPKSAKMAMDFLLKMKNTKLKTMILVEHNYPIAFEVADKVAIIKNGNILNHYTKEDFLKEDFLDNNLYN